jgi:hypothetical protein
MHGSGSVSRRTSWLVLLQHHQRRGLQLVLAALLLEQVPLVKLLLQWLKAAQWQASLLQVQVQMQQVKVVM